MGLAILDQFSLLYSYSFVMCQTDDGRAPRGCGELDIRAEQSLLVQRRQTCGMNEYSTQTGQEDGIQDEPRGVWGSG